MSPKKVRRLSKTLLQISLGLVLLFLGSVSAAQVHADEPIHVSEELHARVLALRQQVAELAPQLARLSPDTAAEGMNLANVGVIPDSTITLGDYAPRAEANYNPPPLFPPPALMPVNVPELNQTNRSDLSASGDYCPIDDGDDANIYNSLCSPFNRLNAYTPYTVLGAYNKGRSPAAVGLGLSGGFGPSSQATASFCPMCFNPNYYRRFQTVDTGALANAFNLADQTIASFSPLLGGANGSQWNQYTSQLQNPGGWNVNSRNPFFAGAGSSVSNTPLNVRSVWGYDPYAVANYNTRFQQSLLQAYSPYYRANTFGGLSFGRVSASSLESQAQAEFIEGYQRIGDKQLELAFQDSNLSTLRTESNHILLLLMYYDPYYLYLDYIFNAYMQSVYLSRPNYQNLYNQAQIVRSRISPPNNTATLRQHYYDRLLLEYYKALVQYESLLYIYNTPNALDTLNAYTTAMSNRLAQVWSTGQAQAWYNDWANRWRSNYKASPYFNNLVQIIEQHRRSYPNMDEFTRLNKEIAELLPTLENLQPVQDTINQANQLLANQNVTNQINQHYSNYNNSLNTILNQTDFTPQVESFNQRLNGLFAGDSTYQQVAQIESQTLTLLLQFQYSVYLAVNQCYQTLGNTCNPNTYPQVTQLYAQQSSNGEPLATTLTKITGQFYEVYNLFWYQFYKSNAYQNLEQNTATQVEGSLTSIANQLKSAQVTFQDNVRAIPQVQQLQTQINQMTSILLGDTPPADLSAVEAASLTTSATQLRQNLNRMAALVNRLDQNTVYLPFISK